MRFGLSTGHRQKAVGVQRAEIAGTEPPVGIEYPASYANLVTKVVGKSVPKGETRTDWRRRPLG